MTPTESITVWNRQAGRLEREQVVGDVMVRWLYGTDPGLCLADTILTRRWLSRIVGAFQSSPVSRTRIAAFIRAYDIAMDEYDAGPFRSFNDFFIRRFTPGARTFCADPAALPAFAEGRYLAYDRVRPDETFPVKGADLTAAAILRDAGQAASFENGPVLIARLCPVDYHRFHYPDAGHTVTSYAVHGRLHSVNPFALRARSGVFAANERRISILETEHFGRLAFVEVGALCVGKIAQTFPADRRFARGDEKGYFLFGASTIILLGEAGRWTPDADLLEQTAQRRETLVRLGERVGGSGAASNPR